jgi:hypothetical protein
LASDSTAGSGELGLARFAARSSLSASPADASDGDGDGDGEEDVVEVAVAVVDDEEVAEALEAAAKASYLRRNLGGRAAGGRAVDEDLAGDASPELMKEA